MKWFTLGQAINSYVVVLLNKQTNKLNKRAANDHRNEEVDDPSGAALQLRKLIFLVDLLPSIIMSISRTIISEQKLTLLDAWPRFVTFLWKASFFFRIAGGA